MNIHEEVMIFTAAYTAEQNYRDAVGTKADEITQNYAAGQYRAIIALIDALDLRAEYEEYRKG